MWLGPGTRKQTAVCTVRVGPGNQASRGCVHVLFQRQELESNVTEQIAVASDAI